MAFVDLLKSEMRRRNYDGKQFAADIGISPAFLSLVLGGKRKVSEKTALSICDRLDLNCADKENFMASYRLESSSDPSFRKVLRQKLSPDEKFKEIDSDRFSPISRWYHNAVMELTHLRDFQPSLPWIARRLKITTVEAELSISRLLRLGFFRKTKRGIEVSDRQVAVKDMPSKAIREHHTQMITKALASIEGQESGERHVSGITIAIDKSRLALANERIRKFRHEMAELLHCETNDAVYQLNVQLFRIDTGE